ncbi:uncharacterized protein L201_007059 [Kwoniella dendrophila CBS 6074]|uniref:Zn(2)-C6 fungal-type domain-containing protein n=1 Tax=Kwoniella dendrophila CBS 6074 TaxID=1295534 RepID=A0AAX4K5P6_9TREE
MPAMTVQPACLRCRSRKTKCLGRTENKACQSCILADAECEVIPHQRGRKVGTKLSESVRAKLKRKKFSNHDVSDRYDEDNACNESGKRTRVVHTSNNDLSIDKGHTSQPLRHRSISSSYQPNRIDELSQTSSVRVNPHLHHDQDYSATDIGPSIRRTSSIAKIFTENKKDGGNRERNAKNGNSSWREDPITCGYIDEGTARKLFKLFMEKIAPNIYIFDNILHTYEYVQRTSSFLFCVIMAVAAKFSPKINASVHRSCLALAKDQILRVFVDDVRSEQTIQALFVLTEYKEADDENAFLLLGMVMDSRMAVDLDLSSTRPDYDERRNRDRQRIWLALYAADKRFNYCGQTAKPSMMPEDDLIRSSESFVYSPICIPVDYRLASNIALRRVLSISIDAIDKDNEFGPGQYSMDLRSVYQTFCDDSDAWVKTQTERDPAMYIHANLTALHAKVIIAHRWVQRSFRNANPTGSLVIEENQERERREALAACINGSLGILATMCQLQDDLLRYTCDSKHLYFAYASFFLYKVFDTKIATTVLDQQSLSYIFGLFRRSAERLDSLALSSTHTIAFHAAFLKRLLRFDDVNKNPAVTQSDQNMPNKLEPQGTSAIIEPSFVSTTTPASNNNESIQPDLDQTLGFFAEPLPDLGNWLLETNTEESLGANIDWNDWWPFDDSSWNFGNTSVNLNISSVDVDNDQTADQDWQGVVHTL